MHWLLCLVLGLQGRIALTLPNSGDHSLWEIAVLVAVGEGGAKGVPLAPRLKITTGGPGDNNDDAQIGRRRGMARNEKSYLQVIHTAGRWRVHVSGGSKKGLAKAGTR